MSICFLKSRNVSEICFCSKADYKLPSLGFFVRIQYHNLVYDLEQHCYLYRLYPFWNKDKFFLKLQIFCYCLEAAPHQGVLFVIGPDSPTTVLKDVNTHTRVMKLKQQDLADRLKMCLLELKKLCIREAVSYCSHSLLHQNTPEERQGSFHTGIRGDFHCMLIPSCFWSYILIFLNNFFRRHVKCCRMLNGYLCYKNKKT